ncbi:MAG: hypothetical protein ABSB33_14665 [Tepidisphaeraceae bacterium]
MNATFSQAGSYVFQVTAIDASGMSNAEDITVTVNQVLTSIAVDPPAPTVIDGQTQIFTAAAYDQFNNPMPLGGGATWSVQTGGVGGTITATGAGQATYTAPTSAVGSDAVVVSVGSINGVGTATVVSVNDVTPSVFSTNLVGLTWTGRSDAQYYQVYSETSGADFTPSYDNLIGDGLTTPWFEDDSVTAGNTYYYQVYSIDDSGNSTEVGTCSIATPAASSPSVQTLPSLGGGETPAAQAPMPPPATPNTVQAIGVNDLELFVSWTQPSQTNVCGYTIDISTDKVNWSLAAVAEPASDSSQNPLAGQVAMNWIVRTTNAYYNGFYNQSQFLTPGVTYYVRVQAFGNGGATSAFSVPSNGASPKSPTSDNVIVIVGGNHEALPQLLQGLEVQKGQLISTTNPGGNSVGNIWYQLIEGGFNAFISADPYDGGDGNLGRSDSHGFSETPDPYGAYPVLNYDGSGSLLMEIGQEESYRFQNQYIGLTPLHLGTVEYGLVGYSHGGGMIDTISTDLRVSLGLSAGAAAVPIAVTIDAIEDSSATDFKPLSENPASQWGGTDVNYWEPNGYAAAGSNWGMNYAEDTLLRNLHGMNLNGAINDPPLPWGIGYAGFDHSTIGISTLILDDAVARISGTFYALSGLIQITGG